MIVKSISMGQKILAYGQTASEWAAWQINSLIGVVCAGIYLVVSQAILRDKKKEQSDKIKDLGMLAVGVIVVAAVVLFFVNNRYGSATGKIENMFN